MKERVGNTFDGTKDLSMQNAIILMNTQITPYIIDPSTQATEWLKVNLEKSNAKVEVVNQQDPRFNNTLELAVRFGKTLVLQEVDQIEPILYPLIRRDLSRQGPRYKNKNENENENIPPLTTWYKVGCPNR
jgi:dynein heavy chain 2, cytosolic